MSHLLIKRFGILYSFFLLILIFSINGHTHINLSTNIFNIKINLFLLFLPSTIFLVFVKHYFKKYKSLFFIGFTFFIWLLQNAFITLTYNILTKDLKAGEADFIWVLILPLTIILITIYGYLFDLIKNKKN